jgi:hypothetical protein
VFNFGEISSFRWASILLVSGCIIVNLLFDIVPFVIWAVPPSLLPTSENLSHDQIFALSLGFDIAQSFPMAILLAYLIITVATDKLPREEEGTVVDQKEEEKGRTKVTDEEEEAPDEEEETPDEGGEAPDEGEETSDEDGEASDEEEETSDEIYPASEGTPDEAKNPYQLTALLEKEKN